MLPTFFRTQNRLVTAQDHSDLILSELSAFVSQVVVLNQDELNALVPSESGNNYNTIFMYILPTYGYIVNNTLQTTILNFIEQFKMITLNYQINPLDFVEIDFYINYKTDKSILNITPSQIENTLINTLRTYFSKSNFSLGEEIRYSDLITDLSETYGLSSLTLSLCADIDGYSAGLQTSNIELAPLQFPIINNIILTDIGSN